MQIAPIDNTKTPSSKKPSGSTSTSAPQSTSHDKDGATGSLTYRLNGASHSYSLWVTKVEQSNDLQGETQQGRYSNHFYPKSYSPGDYQVSIICDGQQDLQDLAVFIRYHHQALIDHVGDFSTNNRQAATKSADFGLLMVLTVQSEGITCRGWVPQFTLTRKGVMDPNPEYTFPFTHVYDYRSADFNRSFIGQQLPSGKIDNRPIPFTPQPLETP